MSCQDVWTPIVFLKILVYFEDTIPTTGKMTFMSFIQCYSLQFFSYEYKSYPGKE